jgi:hypothetical protein
MAGAGLFWEKSTAGWLLVASSLREKYYWLVADKPSEQAVRALGMAGGGGGGRRRRRGEARSRDGPDVLASPADQ